MPGFCCKRQSLAGLLFLLASLGGCASFRVAPARITGLEIVDYHTEHSLPDAPARPVVFYVRPGVDGSSETRAGPELSPYRPGETPGRRPHRPVLKLSVATDENLSRDAERLDAPVTALAYDCDTEVDFDALRIPGIRWHGMMLPDEAASRAIDRAAKPVIYTAYLNLVFTPPSAAVSVPPLDFLRTPQDICFQLIVENRVGDRVRTPTLRVTKATLAAALHRCRMSQCRNKALAPPHGGPAAL